MAKASISPDGVVTLSLSLGEARSLGLLLNEAFDRGWPSEWFPWGSLQENEELGRETLAVLRELNGALAGE